MKTPDKIYCPKQVDIFADLDQDEMEELERMLVLTAYKRGETLYEPSERREVFFLLKTGRVELYRLSPEGRKLVIASIGPGPSFGAWALVRLGVDGPFSGVVE